MSDPRPKPSIPAWQRAPITPPTEDPVYSQPKDITLAPTETSETKPSSAAAWQQESTTPATEDPVYSQPKSDVDDTTTAKLDTTSTSTTTGQQAATIPPAEDPVYSQPTNTNTSKASAESQSANPEITSSPPNHADDARAEGKSYVSDFQRSSSTTTTQSVVPRAAPQTPVSAPPPPIITYPEFLVRAHRPPPLITPSRIFNALYLAGGLAALLYGTSQYLVAPMVDSLSASRHDFYSHSQSKVDELNERLSKLVSKVPAAAAAGKKEALAGAADERDNKDADAESVTSDPTELYHRDMGTQTDIDASTSPAADAKTANPTALESSSSSSSAHEAALAHDTKALAAIEAHLSDILSSSAANAETARHRLDSINKLRHYLDQLCYAGAGINVWTGNDDRAAANGSGAGGNNNTKPEDAIDSLKREIRSVKGVLLSAKRFPSYAPGAGAGGGNGRANYPVAVAGGAS